MELAIGEVLGNGMFVFCGIQGILALFFTFKVNPVEYVRDTCFYLLSLSVLLLVLIDGEISLLEGLTFVALYAIYVVTVVQFERIMQVPRTERAKEAGMLCVCVRERERECVCVFVCV